MLIKMKEYERIFQVVSAVVESEEGNSAHACIQFSLFGANILVDHYGLEAKVRCGLATYYLGDDDHVLCFGEETAQGIAGTQKGFHCWVEANGWILDFMAPKFGDLMKTEFTATPRMFQRKKSEMKEHPNDMAKTGDFFLHHDQDLADAILTPICEHLGMQDLAGLCSQWFKKPPKKILPSVATMDQNCKIRPVNLKPVFIKTKW
ncbi:DUF2026 family protein [Thalassovita mangrovi]|uniref:DUF2026 domain-containing protein n=1 Tax=Thalassovita mangrovi TaxID=2692236 RepID=A0A6L8LMU7_9RHOB|nr:DUF2026 family protein [Thalassovita mangrovi]MYM57368.1 DUF2026 domain-containing protein [Thalassovita mangrovi]